MRYEPERLNSTVPAWEGESLNELIARWTTGDEYKRYEPHVVSSPEKVHRAQYKGPWVITFDAFLDDSEIVQISKGASYDGFERSTDQGKIVGGSGETANW